VILSVGSTRWSRTATPAFNSSVLGPNLLDSHSGSSPHQHHILLLLCYSTRTRAPTTLALSVASPGGTPSISCTRSQSPSHYRDTAPECPRSPITPRNPHGFPGLVGAARSHPRTPVGWKHESSTCPPSRKDPVGALRTQQTLPQTCSQNRSCDRRQQKGDENLTRQMITPPTTPFSTGQERRQDARWLTLSPAPVPTLIPVAAPVLLTHSSSSFRPQTRLMAIATSSPPSCPLLANQTLMIADDAQVTRCSSPVVMRAPSPAGERPQRFPRRHPADPRRDTQFALPDARGSISPSCS
jgi:hypothetical protein